MKELEEDVQNNKEDITPIVKEIIEKNKENKALKSKNEMIHETLVEKERKV